MKDSSGTKNHQSCLSCLESIPFHARIGHPIKHETFFHIKYHTIIGETVWLMTKQIPSTIKNAFQWAWFREYCGQLSFKLFLRPIPGWKLAWDIAYQCNEVW